jgi:hypothetical protein
MLTLHPLLTALLMEQRTADLRREADGRHQIRLARGRHSPRRDHLAHRRRSRFAAAGRPASQAGGCS